MATQAVLELQRRMVPEWTPEKLAQELGVSRQAVSAWLTAKSKPNLEKMARLEELLGIPMRAWLEEEEGA